MRTLFRWHATLLALTALLVFASAPSAQTPSAQTPSASDLGAAMLRLEADQSPGATTAAAPRERRALGRLYAGDSARPLWSVPGHLTRQAHDLVDVLDRVDARGLVRDDYDVDGLRTLATSIGRDASARDLAEFDVRASRALVRLLWHLHAGRTNPRPLGFEIPETHDSLDLAALARAVSRADDVRAAIAAAEPPYAGYARLMRARARYRALAADPTLPPPLAVRGVVRPGDPFADAPALRRLLRALGDLGPGPGRRDSAVAEDHYDRTLAEAVRNFQTRHGLEPDGVLGPATLAQLRVPLARRVRQMDLTLERWRWLPDRVPARYAVVNIPGFRLYVFGDDPTARSPALAMRVIVGDAQLRRHTPVFTGTIREVVFRPFWDVPPSIARHEVIPRIRRQPGYVDAEGLEIVRGGDVGATNYAMTPANLDRVTAGTLRIRQRPGPRNALGAVKFVFPNDHNVYLHGTPAVELFASPRRDFSHGCIRVEDPAGLAAYVLDGQAGWNRAAIDSAMNADGTRRIRVERPVAVFVLYATTVVSEDGVVFFHPDLYGHDAALERALGLPPIRAPRDSARR